MTTLYWAYGSNLNVRAMKRRCPDAVKGSAFSVGDAALIFRGVADVTIRKGTTVPGGLWHITPRCERSLDSYEGVGSRLYLKRYLPVKVGGVVHKVLFYQMSTSRGVMPPSQEYADVIARGYRDFGLDVSILHAAIAESWVEKAPTNFLRQRHEKRGSPRFARNPLAQES